MTKCYIVAIGINLLASVTANASLSFIWNSVDKIGEAASSTYNDVSKDDTLTSDSYELSANDNLGGSLVEGSISFASDYVGSNVDVIACSNLSAGEISFSGAFQVSENAKATFSFSGGVSVENGTDANIVCYIKDTDTNEDILSYVVSNPADTDDVELTSTETLVPGHHYVLVGHCDTLSVHGGDGGIAAARWQFNLVTP